MRQGERRLGKSKSTEEDGEGRRGDTVGGSDREGSVPDEALQGRAAEGGEREGAGEKEERGERRGRGCVLHPARCRRSTGREGGERMCAAQ